MTRRAFVLGGGVAGLSAALGLADRGYDVILLESRGWLGGRAFAFVDRKSGRRLDNGPHVMLGCYRAMRKLIRRLGTEHLLQQDRCLAMAYRGDGGEVTHLKLPAMPVPLAMPIGMLRMRMGLGAKFRALWGMGSVLLGARAAWTVEDWARRRRQLGEPAAMLWEPLCRSIMNVEMRHASARDFLNTLREAFSGRARSAALWLPRASWSEIIGDPAIRMLADASVQVRTGARVVALTSDGDRIASVELGDGEKIAIGDGDIVVSAMPWFALKALVPSMQFSALRGSPIVSVHFAISDGAPPLPDDGPVVALTGGGPFHFVLRTPGAQPGQFAMLAGGNRWFDGMKTDAIEAAGRAQLARYYPGFDRDVNALVRVSKENAATFIAAPGAQSLRPAPGRLPGGPHNLLVCGDWTATGLPATLEGAVRSAEKMLTAVPSA